MKEQFQEKRRLPQKKKKILKKRPKYQKARNTNIKRKTSRPSSSNQKLLLTQTRNKKQRFQMQRTMHYQKSKLKNRLQGKRKAKRQK